jgi:hypothetical protein
MAAAHKQKAQVRGAGSRVSRLSGYCYACALWCPLPQASPIATMLTLLFVAGDID